MNKISGFTYIRNGITYGYPFLASIKSILPIVDELIVVVGDSTDGTRESIVKIGDSRIKIVDSIWDENLRNNGKVFAQQSNIGINHIQCDWGLHIQADEVIHESEIIQVRRHIERASDLDEIDGLLLPYYHFWGDYYHIRNTRNTHRFEIRAFKNNRKVFSYKDSQGFRKYSSLHSYETGGSGIKLNVLNTGIPIYHYSYVRNPKLMKKKSNIFSQFYHSNSWLQKNTNDFPFDYNEVDKLEEFNGEHPVYMKNYIKNKDWEFVYDPKKSNMSFKDKVLNKFEKITNYHLFEYRNYKLKA